MGVGVCLYVCRLLSICVSMHHVHSWCLRRQKRVVELEVIENCEPPCGCWEPNPGPLEEQAVLLTGESSLQPLFLLYKKIISLCGGDTHL